jgi:AcrR family transcriptional regulator
MGSRERRERERESTRRRIQDVARDLFVEQGYQATTMRAIAERLEFTPTAIYHHFESKEALFHEVCLVDFHALAQAFQRIGRIDDPLERIERIGAAYVDFALENPMQYRFMFMAHRPPAASAEDLGRGDPSQDAYAFLRNTCREGIEQGRFRPEYDDAEEIAQICWASVHGIVSLHIQKAQDEWIDFRDARTTSAKLRSIVLQGLMRDS